MKKIIFTLSVISASLLFGSCEKINKSLTVLPKDDINPEAYFTSESECQLWLNRCYYNYSVTPVTGAKYWGDDCVNTESFPLVEGTRQVTDTQTGETAWGWDTMRRINLFLAHSSNCKDEAVRVKYEAIARYFRAQGYCFKLERFGDVPWYDHVLSSTDQADLSRPRDPRGFVMLNILKDLDFAIANLGDGKDVAHVTKWAALALKSRIALFEGTWRIYHANDEFAPKNDPTEFDGKPVTLSAEYFLNISIEASKQIMDSGLFSLYNTGTQPYRDLFKSDNANPDEFIMARLYNNTSSELKNYGHNLPYQYTNKSYGFTKRFVNMYLNADGTRYTDTNPDYATAWYLDEIKGRDPRLAQTIMCPGFKLDGDKDFTFNDFSTTITGYKPIKWKASADNEKQNKGIADLAYYRYAEILLNYIEAKMELGGAVSQTDVDNTINLIRKRAGVAVLKLDGLTKDDYMVQCYPNYTRSKAANPALLLELRRERVLELVLEGNHLWDMLRWGEGAQLLDNAFPQYGGTGHTGYYGVYIPGPGQYDMDGDGVVDFELYVDQPVGGPSIKKSVKLSTLALIDPENPSEASPTKGYVTGFKDVKYCNKWNEKRDYLYPIPLKQITLTNGSLKQNPNW